MRQVRAFYEQFPYPQLPVSEKKDVARHLHETVMRRMLASANLSPNELQGKSVLDAGCGTGEKSVYFAMHGANATGIDVSRASLAIAKQNAKNFKVEKRCNFQNIDLFSLPSHFPPASFHHIFSIGVIHHTKNPKECVRIFSDLLKPKGTLTIGLYHLYGRLPLRIHRAFIKASTGGNLEKGFDYLEKSMLKRKFKSEMEKAYLADTYLHPHETYHTIFDAKKWFASSGLEFIGTMPKANSFADELGWFSRCNGFFFASAKKL